MGKGEIARYFSTEFSPFPKEFSKDLYCRRAFFFFFSFSYRVFKRLLQQTSNFSFPTEFSKDPVLQTSNYSFSHRFFKRSCTANKQFLHFPQNFPETCTADTEKHGLLGKRGQCKTHNSDLVSVFRDRVDLTRGL